MRFLIVMFLLMGCSQADKVEDKRIDWMKPGTNEKVVFKAPTKPVEKTLEVIDSRGRLMEFKPADTHKVVKGECLWWIAEYKGIYGDPFKWPVIYKANRHQIKDPDLIYPGQELIIPR